ncbi:hypothetical protein ACOMHN_056957 [Nucella lapillus]
MSGSAEHHRLYPSRQRASAVSRRMRLSPRDRASFPTTAAPPDGHTKPNYSFLDNPPPYPHMATSPLPEEAAHSPGDVLQAVVGDLAGRLNDSGHYLKTLEEAEALDQLPVLLLLALMAVVGVAGNGVVLYVYYTRFTPSSTRTYILAMSVFDILFCSVSLPGEVLDLRFPLTYNAKWLCRLHRLISVSLTLVSAMTLVAVALDRRRKICYPFRSQLTSRQVTLSVVGCLVSAVAVGVPFGVMNGRHSVKTHVEGLQGAACSVDDQFIHTSFPLIYNGLLLLIFLACVVAMSVSYAQIARKIVRHKRKSVAHSGGGAVAGLALLLAKHPPGQNTETSSHFEGSSELESRHRQPCEGIEDSKVEDDVFASQADPREHSHDVLATRISPSQCESGKSTPAEKSGRPTPAKKSGKTFRSRSVKKREEELEVAVKTLVHAVSADTLHSNELFKHREPQPLHRSRSASVEETALSLSRKRLPDASPHPSNTASSKVSNDVKNNAVVKTSVTSSKRGTDIEDIRKENECKTKTDANATGSSEEQGTKRIERNMSIKSNDETQGKGIKRNASLKSSVKSRNGTKPDDEHVRHVTISETRSERLQSFVNHTLTRIKSRTNSAGDDIKSTSSVHRRHWGKGIPSRTTWMMFVLTAIFIISYLPYLTIVCVRATHHDIETGLHGWKLNLYTLGLKSYFINSIVNPFVYSFCSARFRHQCQHLFRRRSKMSISD